VPPLEKKSSLAAVGENAALLPEREHPLMGFCASKCCESDAEGSLVVQQSSAGPSLLDKPLKRADFSEEGLAEADAGEGDYKMAAELFDKRSPADGRDDKATRSNARKEENEQNGEEKRPIGYFECDLWELANLTAADGALEEERPLFQFKSGASYQGQWRGNMRHGFGLQVWPDGVEFRGQWVENRAEGYGRVTHSNGDCYIGQWAANKAHGEGICRHLREGGQQSYEGEWVQDSQEGLGVETWGDGSRFCGIFVGGGKHAYGVYYWPDGSRYDGVWEGNCITGPGEFSGADGRTFRGQWVNSKIHGRGRYSWKDGRLYWGQYLNDKKDGFGVHTWPDGRMYTGWWKAGLQEGPSKITNARGHKGPKPANGFQKSTAPPQVRACDDDDLD